MNITRRTFTKAVAGAAAGLLLPSRLIAERQPPEFDLRQFCDPEATARYNLSLPFEQQGLTYATDGRIAVRCLHLLAPEHAEEVRLPDAAGLPWRHAELHKWRPWPKPTHVKEVTGVGCPCPDCEGKGRVGADVRECDVCDASGYVATCPNDLEAEGFYEVACVQCKKEGYLGGDKCGRCKGDGTVYYAQQVGGEVIAPLFDKKIRTLDCVEHQILPQACPEGTRGGVMDVILFRFNGGEGIVAPLYRD